MTPEHITALLAEACRRDLKRFITTFWKTIEPVAFVDGYHVDAICEHLTALRDGTIRNLAVMMPPRCSKSSIISTMFPAWVFAKDPSAKFICSSYSIQLAERDSVRTRQLIESELYKLYYSDRFCLSSDQNTKRRQETSAGGFRLATSLDGSTTGEGGTYLLADDMHNVQEAESKASREAVIRWFSTVWMNRLNEPATGRRCIVGQRCHHEDVFGWLLKNDKGNDWVKLILPLEGGKCKFKSTRWTDTRAEGELLCPERIPPAEVRFLREQQGKRTFDAQWNQNPRPPEDALFKEEDIQFYDVLPEGGLRIAAVDLAISQKGDYTVMGIADVHSDGSMYVVHLHRERMPGSKLVPTIKALHERFKTQIVYIEDVSFQRLVIDDARRQGVPVKPVRPEGSKESRSVMLQVMMDNRKVFFPKDATWFEQAKEELLEFPNGTHDDVVDVLTYLAIEASVLYRRVPEAKPKETEGERHERLKREHQETMRKALLEGLF